MYTDKAKLLEIAKILIEVAEKKSIIYYSDLGAKVGIANPRSLAEPLGKIFMACRVVEFPLMSTLVINKATLLPGRGYFEIYGEVKKENWKKIFDIELEKVHSCKNLSDLIKIINDQY